MIRPEHTAVCSFELLSFPTSAALAEAAAEAWLAEVVLHASQRRLFLVALAGGRIVQQFYEAVVARARARQTGFGHVHFFWSDERCVPPTDPASNYAVARKYLLEPLGIEPGRIHRIRGEDEPVRAAAELAEIVKRLVPGKAAGAPVFDLIFLGLGEDGHVASLFPDGMGEGVHPRPHGQADFSVGSSGRLENRCHETGAEAPYLPVMGPKPPPQRITMTYRTIVAARAVWVLASGEGKEKALEDSLASDSKTPLGLVIGQRGATRIFTDIKHRPPV